jgi:hypothetical protein
VRPNDAAASTMRSRPGTAPANATSTNGLELVAKACSAFHPGLLAGRVAACVFSAPPGSPPLVLGDARTKTPALGMISKEERRCSGCLSVSSRSALRDLELPNIASLPSDAVAADGASINASDEGELLGVFPKAYDAIRCRPDGDDMGADEERFKGNPTPVKDADRLRGVKLMPASVTYSAGSASSCVLDDSRTLPDASPFVFLLWESSSSSSEEDSCATIPGLKDTARGRVGFWALNDLRNGGVEWDGVISFPDTAAARGEVWTGEGRAGEEPLGIDASGTDAATAATGASTPSTPRFRTRNLEPVELTATRAEGVEGARKFSRGGMMKESDVFVAGAADTLSCSLSLSLPLDESESYFAGLRRLRPRLLEVSESII